MKASNIQKWPVFFGPAEWPANTLDKMDASLFTDLVFPVREKAGFSMWPSSLYGAHIRTTGNSRHSTKGGTRLADATDLHTKTIEQMIKAAFIADEIPAAGGIGIYFDTNTPMIHLDAREGRLMWLRRSIVKNGKKTHEYIYRENDRKRFDIILNEQIILSGGKRPL